MKKVLIIEDDGFLQGLEVAKLEKSNYAVITASNGEEAMNKIYEPDISIILLDLMLPIFDGYEVLKKIRGTESLKNIPVIVFSNLSEKSEFDKARQLGANDFMVKSNFTLDELVKKINAILK